MSGHDEETAALAVDEGAAGGNTARSVVKLVGCLLPVAAVPFVGGIVVLGLGLATLADGNRTVARRDRYLRDSTFSRWGELRVGDPARVRGTVVEGPEQKAPLSGRSAVLVQTSLVETTGVGDDGVKWERTWTDPFTLRCEEGTVLVDATSTSLLKTPVGQRSWEGDAPEDVVALVGAAAKQLQTTFRSEHGTRPRRFELVERTIEVGDPLTVRGEVTAIERSEAAGTGYRASTTRSRLAIDVADATDATDVHLASIGERGEEDRLAGLVCLALALANFVGFGWLLLHR